MKMTAQHFELIAEVIAEMPTFSASLRTAQKSAANSFAEKLGRKFPLFNTNRFLDACKLPEVES